MRSYDAAVVGAGILGLAHAYQLAKNGMRVGVFERSAKAQGASVRNFGMLWPIGQPPGRMHELAMRSREIWLEILRSSGLWHEMLGSLHLAYRDDEAEVLREFQDAASGLGFDTELLSPRQAMERSPVLNPEGLRAGLISPTEICMDPREDIAGLPGWLARTFGVEFHLGHAVSEVDETAIVARDEEWRADHVFVCNGDDFETLFPEIFSASRIVRCKLQMMRSAPATASQRIGPMLAAGLTLRHYRAFDGCPSLPALRERIARETPEYDRYGIHVMASQNGLGEIVIGDSHEYGSAIEPFDKEAIDQSILDYLRSFVPDPDLRIVSRWHGIYGKHPDLPFFTAAPSPRCRIVTGVGGAGITLSFGLAEAIVNDRL